jgi:sterol desaturase/sphingolipid hydroxylase (fatty acid hydroxylase superfamily)
MATFFENIIKNINIWGFTAMIVAIVIVGIIEFALKLYQNKWTKNERKIDIFCFVVPRIALRPLVAFVSFWLLPFLFPKAKNLFDWIPFWWAFTIIALTDDLIIYWLHRLHHEIPQLWRFHRTHHSAPYMGMAMAGRQNFISNIYISFPQIYIVAAATYFGQGTAALVVTVFKTLVTLGAHSSIPWDKPFYKYKILHPLAWVLERLISTPATHHAHHANTSDDGIGYYKGNFANVFFIWDIIFKTGKITRKYPTSYGLKFYKDEEWYAQLLWPLLKSKTKDSELSKNGPIVGDNNSIQ